MTPNITKCSSVLDGSHVSAAPSMTPLCHGTLVSRCLSDRDSICACTRACVWFVRVCMCIYRYT